MCFPGKRLEPGRLGHLPQDVRPSSAFIQLRVLFVVPLGAAAWTIEFILPGPQVGYKSDMSIAFRHHLSYVALLHVAVVAQDTPIGDAAPSQFEASTPSPSTANTFLFNFFGMDDWPMSLPRQTFTYPGMCTQPVGQSDPHGEYGVASSNLCRFAGFSSALYTPFDVVVAVPFSL